MLLLKGKAHKRRNKKTDTKGWGRMELTVKVKLGNAPTMRKVAQAAAVMSTFNAQVLLRREDITVNAKSLMGLLSLGLRDGMGVTIIANGEDEAQAVCEMSRLLQDGD